MSFETKTLKPTADGTPGPQQYNKIIGDFEPVEGVANAVNNIGPRVIYSYSGNTAINPSAFGTGVSLLIANDGTFTLTLQINSMVFTIKPGEVFDEVFNPFTVLSITTFTTYRMWIRGF